MRRISLLLLLLGIAVFISGCGGRSSGWRAKITDTEGKPINRAKLCVWQYPLTSKNPDQELGQITSAWSQGKLAMRGWFFYSGTDGNVICNGIPVGREVVDAYVPGYTVRSPRRDRVRIVWRRDRNGHVERTYEYQDNDNYVYVPPVTYSHWKPGEWLGVIVTAEGYDPYSFTFKPDSESGSLGTIQMIRADNMPTTLPPASAENNGG